MKMKNGDFCGYCDVCCPFCGDLLSGDLSLYYYDGDDYLSLCDGYDLLLMMMKNWSCESLISYCCLNFRTMKMNVLMSDEVSLSQIGVFRATTTTMMMTVVVEELLPAFVLPH